MKILKTKINGHDIKVHKENSTLFIECQGSKIPIYHIKNMIRIIQVYENIFESADHVLKDKLFNLDVKYSDVKGIYDEIYINN